MQKYLHARDMNLDDMTKIWKGLFYCMWMSDKMPVQQELARGLAAMIHSCSSDDNALLFLSAFYNTMMREWIGIDRLRIDKFYYLLQQVERQSLEYLARQGWKQSLIVAYGDVLLNTLLLPQATAVGGIVLHYLQHFWTEFSHVTKEVQRLRAKQLAALALPFLECFCTTKPAVASLVREHVLQPMVDSLSNVVLAAAASSTNDTSNNNDTNETDDENDIGRFKSSARVLARSILNVASSRDVATIAPRRRTLYALHRTLCQNFELSLTDASAGNNAGVDDDDDDENDVEDGDENNNDNNENDQQFDAAIDAFVAENGDISDDDDDDDDDNNNNNNDINDINPNFVEETAMTSANDNTASTGVTAELDDDDFDRFAVDGVAADGDADALAEIDADDGFDGELPITSENGGTGGGVEHDVGDIVEQASDAEQVVVVDDEITVDMTPRRQRRSKPFIARADSEITVDMTPRKQRGSDSNNESAKAHALVGRADSEITFDVTPRKQRRNVNENNTASTSLSTTTTPLIARVDSEISVDMTPRKSNKESISSPAAASSSSTTTTTATMIPVVEHDPKIMRKLTQKNTRLNIKLSKPTKNLNETPPTKLHKRSRTPDSDTNNNDNDDNDANNNDDDDNDDDNARSKSRRVSWGHRKQVGFSMESPPSSVRKIQPVTEKVGLTPQRKAGVDAYSWMLKSPRSQMALQMSQLWPTIQSALGSSTTSNNGTAGATPPKPRAPPRVRLPLK